MDWIGLSLPTNRHRPVVKYGSEKAMDLARSAVAVMEEMIKSILCV